MPQTPAPQRPVRSRVTSGVPWWLWTILLVIGGGVGTSLVMRSIPLDPELLFTDALAAAQKNDAKTVQRNLDLLKTYPDRVPQQKMLEAIMLIGRSRPLKAIPLLKEVAKDPALRMQALNLLGGAYAAATDRQTALATFETILQEDENAHEARWNIARILNDNFAWEESLKHLNILVEQKIRLPQVLQVRGDIRAELRQFPEAAEDFEQSIKADPADPTNGVKAAKLMHCLSETGNYEKMSEYLESVDAPNVREIARAETLLAKDDLKGATDALESTLREDPTNPELNCVYAKIMLKSHSQEKALEAVTRLRPVLALVTRNADLYRACAELARVAGDNELADLSQQNVDQLDVLEQEFHARLAAIIKSRDDVDGRLALVDLAMNTGRFEFIRKIYDGLIGYHPERTAEFHSKMMEMDRFVPPLVSLGIEQPPAAPQPDPVAGQPPVVEPAPVPDNTGIR